MSTTEVIYTDVKHRENRLKMLRMETFSPSDYLHNVISSIKESSLSLSDYFLYHQGFKGENKALSALRSTLSKAGSLEGFNFVLNQRMVVPCPTGFKENFHEYTSILNAGITPVAEEVYKQLDLLNVELSQFITNKSVKVSVRDEERSMKAIEKWRQSTLDAVSSYFSSGNNQRQLLGKMFNNTPQILTGTREAIEAFEKAYKNDPRDLKGTVDTIVAKINTIVEMSTGSEKVEISQESIRNVAEKSFIVGRLVELLGLYYTQCETAAVLSSDILERCMKQK